MPETDWFTLFNMSKDDVMKKFIPTRRFLNNGFELDPRYHRNGKVCVTSPNQTILVDVLTGDFEDA